MSSFFCAIARVFISPSRPPFPVHLPLFLYSPLSSLTEATFISVSQCILFLLPVYSLYVPLSRRECRKCRRSVIHNHCISLQVLNRFNPSLSLARLLCPFDLEHLYIADRLLLRATASLLPTPLVSGLLSSLTPRSSQRIAYFYQGREQDPFFRPSLGAIRLLLEDSAHSPELSLLIRFAAAVFSRHHIVCSQTPLLSSSLPSSTFRVSLPFQTRFSPLRLFVPFRSSSTTRGSGNDAALSRRIWLAALLLQQVVRQQGTVDGQTGTDGTSTLPPAAQLSIESSLRLCHTREEILSTLHTLSLSRFDLVRVALQCCSEDSGRFIDASLIELMRYIDPVQSVVEVTREVSCVIELMTFQQRRAFYWLIRVLEECNSLIPLCVRELTDSEPVRSKKSMNRRNCFPSSSRSV